MNRNRRRPHATLAVTLTVGLALTACGGTSTADTVAAPEPAPVTSSLAPSAAVTSTAPIAPAPPPEMKVGQAYDYKSPTGELLTATVLKHKTTSDVEAVDVKVCNTGALAFTTSRGPWVLLYDGGDSEHDIDISGGGLPAPAYPDTLNPKNLVKGKCARGWVNFAIIEEKRPYGVAYQVENGPAVWKF